MKEQDILEDIGFDGPDYVIIEIIIEKHIEWFLEKLKLFGQSKENEPERG